MHTHHTSKAGRLLKSLVLTSALGTAVLAAAPAQAFDGGCCCDDGRYNSVGFGAAGTSGGFGLGGLGGGFGGYGGGYGAGYGASDGVPGYGAGYGGPAYAGAGGGYGADGGYGGYGRGFAGTVRRRPYAGPRSIGYAPHRGPTLRRLD